MDYVFSIHSLKEIKRRNLSYEVIIKTIEEPQQVLKDKYDNFIYQSKYTINDKNYMMRVILNNDKPNKVITCYKTSKIDKYWVKNEN